MNNTKILKVEKHLIRMKIIEVFFIQTNQPVLDQQVTDSCWTLELHSSGQAAVRTQDNAESLLASHNEGLTLVHRVLSL